jgi:DNA-binding transcriptional ArsR family regulator
MYGQELAQMFSVTAPTVSYHMTKLVVSGLAESYFDCGKSYFRVNTKNLRALEKSFHDFFDPNIKR